MANNPRCPTDTLTAAETGKLRELVRLRGEREAIAAVGLRSAEAFYKAMAGAPVLCITADCVRGRLDRI